MYSEWVSLQAAIQTESSHTSVLKRFPPSVGKDIVSSVVKSIAQGLSINSNDQPSKLQTADDVNWTMEVICYGLSLPFAEHDLIKDCVSIYCEWLSGCLIKKRLCVPKSVVESPIQYFVTILSHLYNLFVPREKATVDHISKQAMLCHRALRKLEDIAKESQYLNRDSWECMLKFLLAVTDTLLAPPKEKDGVSDELAERVISVLFEMWLLSCSNYFPTPSLWRTFRDMCANWRHHEAVIVQWNKMNHALAGPLLVKLYGPDHPPLASADKLPESSLMKESVSKLSEDRLVQCWFRFLHILGNPVDLCHVEVISDTPKFLHHALTSDKVIEPYQHECLLMLPRVFYKAMRGLSIVMDGFLGINQPQKDEELSLNSTLSRVLSTTSTPPLAKSSRTSSISISTKVQSPVKQSSASLHPATSMSTQPAGQQTQQAASVLLQYAQRPALASSRSSVNSVLNLLGAWLFEAALSHVTRQKPRGSISHHAGSMSSPGSKTSDGTDLSFDDGRAEACGAVARLLCSKKTGEVIQPVYVAKSYITIYHALSLSQPIKGEVMTLTLFHMADMLRLDLPGVNILIPRILPALEYILKASQENLRIHEHLPEVELRKACIHLLLSLVCLPLHYNKTEIKDLFTGDTLYQFSSLKTRLAKLILCSLSVERDSTNCTMLLGALSLLIQDYSTHEYREREKLSSDTSSVSLDHTHVSTDVQNASEVQADQSEADLILRKSKSAEEIDSAAALIGMSAKQICASLIKSWWSDYNLALSALEVLSLLAKIKLQLVDSAMCKETLLKVCHLITALSSKPPKNQTRDLHSTLIATFHCLSNWIIEHSYLMQNKECLYAVLEVVELGISGKKSQQNGMSELILKGEKEHLPVSLRVKDAAEALLMCLTDQVDSFPCPCGSESLYSMFSEKDLTDDVRNFKYFSLNGATILAILAESKTKEATSVVKIVIRGPFGRQIWLMEPQSQSSTTSVPAKVSPPPPVELSKERPRIKQRWWPASVDKIPLVNADKSIPSFESLVDFDSELGSFLGDRIDKCLKDQVKPGTKSSSIDCSLPKAPRTTQSARLILSQLGLTGAASLQESQGLLPYLGRLESSAEGFYEALAAIDTIPNRTRDSVYIFYVKSGQTRVSEILDNTKGYKSLNSGYKDFLLSLGWPVNVHAHPGWTALQKSSLNQRPKTQEPDLIPSSSGPSAFDGTRWLLYWADCRSEVAFIVPTEERAAMITKLSQASRTEKKDVVFSGGVDTGDIQYDTASTGGGSIRETSRTTKASADIKMVVVWCEKIEDKDSVPIEGLLNMTSSVSEADPPAEYLLVYITALNSGLLRIHLVSHTDRPFAPLPLVDGMVCSKRTIGLMVRQTAINMAARRRLLSDLSLIPHNKKLQKTQEFINKYRVECSEAEFYESLFTV